MNNFRRPVSLSKTKFLETIGLKSVHLKSTMREGPFDVGRGGEGAIFWDMKFFLDFFMDNSVFKTFFFGLKLGSLIVESTCSFPFFSSAPLAKWPEFIFRDML